MASERTRAARSHCTSASSLGWNASIALAAHARAARRAPPRPSAQTTGPPRPPPAAAAQAAKLESKTDFNVPFIELRGAAASADLKGKRVWIAASWCSGCCFALFGAHATKKEAEAWCKCAPAPPPGRWGHTASPHAQTHARDALPAPLSTPRSHPRAHPDGEGGPYATSVVVDKDVDEEDEDEDEDEA